MLKVVVYDWTDATELVSDMLVRHLQDRSGTLLHLGKRFFADE